MIDSIVLGFGHRARSGKDTAVAEIIAKRGLLKPEEMYNVHVVPQNEQDYMLHYESGFDNQRYEIRRYAFADALKREVNVAAKQHGGMKQLFETTLTTFPDWVKYDPNAPMDDPMCPLGKQRTLLQWWGAEYRRAQDPDYWVRQLANTIELDKPQVALISDLRFPNEMKFVLQHGEAVRVDRDSLPPATHISETALEDSTDWSLILDNNGTLEEFKEGAVVAFDELMTNFPFGFNRHSA